MAFPQGIDFRATSGFVTDPTNCTFETFATAPPTYDYPFTTPQGNVVGFNNVGQGTVGTPHTQDNNNALDPRLAGDTYTDPNAQLGFLMDLPAAGSYNINMGFGGSAANGPYSLLIYDGNNLSTATLLQTVVSSGSNGAGQWFDATGNLRTSAAAWVTANPQGGGGTGQITLTFATTHALFEIVGLAGFVPISHIWMSSAATSVHSVQRDQTLSFELVARVGEGIEPRVMNWWMPPVANIIVTPTAPIIPNTTPLGAVVATIDVSVSDGSAVQNSLQLGFGPPYFSDGGTFSLVKLGPLTPFVTRFLLLVNPNGPGVGPDGSTVQRVNVITA